MQEQIIDITDADKIKFVEATAEISKWLHSVNRHNGFWEQLETLIAVAGNAGHELQTVALREVIFGRIALIHSEPSEALEAVRKHDPSTWGSTEKDTLASELAGSIVRIMDLAYWLKLPIGDAIIAEVNRNSVRGYMHGGKNG